MSTWKLEVGTTGGLSRVYYRGEPVGHVAAAGLQINGGSALPVLKLEIFVTDLEVVTATASEQTPVQQELPLQNG